MAIVAEPQDEELRFLLLILAGSVKYGRVNDQGWLVAVDGIGSASKFSVREEGKELMINCRGHGSYDTYILKVAMFTRKVGVFPPFLANIRQSFVMCDGRVSFPGYCFAFCPRYGYISMRQVGAADINCLEHPTREVAEFWFTEVSAEVLHSKISAEYWGVSRAQVVEFLEVTRDFLRAGRIENKSKHVCGYSDEKFCDPSFGPTMYDVNEYVIKPVTGGRAKPVWYSLTAPAIDNLSWALMVNSQTGGLQCDLFASHAWAEGVFEFGSALTSSWDTSWGDRWHACYICFLSNPQNLNIGKILGTRPSESPFAIALKGKSMAQMIMVVNSNVAIHRRLWCVYEAHLAFKLKVPVKIAGDAKRLCTNAEQCDQAIKAEAAAKRNVVVIKESFVKMEKLGDAIVLILCIGFLAILVAVLLGALIVVIVVSYSTHGAPDTMVYVIFGSIIGGICIVALLCLVFPQLGIACSHCINTVLPDNRQMRYARARREAEGARIRSINVRAAECTNEDDRKAITQEIEQEGESVWEDIDNMMADLIYGDHLGESHIREEKINLCVCL